MRRNGIMAALVAALWSAPLCGAGVPEKIFEGFESGFGTWAPHTYISCAPDCELVAEIALTDDVAFEGAAAVSLYGEGWHDEGLLWIERSVPLPPGSWEVSVTFQLNWPHDDANVGTWQVVAGLSLDPIVDYSDFAVLGLSGDAGWSSFSHAAVVAAEAPSSLQVAVGVQIVFETALTHYLDAVTITLAPASQPADLDGNGVVDGGDLGLLLGQWGPCSVGGECPADLDGSGAVDGGDLGVLLGAWS